MGHLRVLETTIQQAVLWWLLERYRRELNAQRYRLVQVQACAWCKVSNNGEREVINPVVWIEDRAHGTSNTALQGK